MPMTDLQRRAAKVGRIRTGISVVKDGKQRPEKLTRFLLTTESRTIADAITSAYGGKVDPYHPMGGAQRGWQVLVDVDELPVAVPPGVNVVSQWWEKWTGGGLERRCDGETASVWESGGGGEQRGPCRCPSDLLERAAGAAARTPTACHPTTRVSLVLPDVPGTGTFMVESHGLYAAQELAGVAEVMERALAAGVMLPALLRLEQREGVRRPGQTTNKFAVPVLSLLHSIRELEQLARLGPSASALPPAPPNVRALTAGPSGQNTPPGGQNATETAPPAVAGPVGRGGGMDALVDAQAAADRAATVDNLEELTDLARVARDRDWMAETVQGPDDVYDSLGSVLLARREALT